MRYRNIVGSMASENHRVLVICPSQEDKARLKDRVLRLRRFADWLTANGLLWHSPDLTAYARYLCQEWKLSPVSIKAHLSTIRARYRELLAEGTIQAELARQAPSTSPSDQTTYIMRALGRMEKESEPSASLMRIIPGGTERLTLTREEAFNLIRQPGTQSKSGLRDTAIIATLLGTGIRPIELVGLQVEDIQREDYREARVFHVPPCRGCVERLVPYLDWGVRGIVEKWLRDARIEAGPVFSGFFRGEAVRNTPLSRRTVEQILSSYPIEVDGRTVRVKAMDLRRTHARWLYESGEDIRTIRHNLGLKSLDTVEQYLGEGGVDEFQSGFDVVFNLSRDTFES